MCNAPNSRAKASCITFSNAKYLMNNDRIPSIRRLRNIQYAYTFQTHPLILVCKQFKGETYHMYVPAMHSSSVNVIQILCIVALVSYSQTYQTREGHFILLFFLSTRTSWSIATLQSFHAAIATTHVQYRAQSLPGHHS